MKDFEDKELQKFIATNFSKEPGSKYFFNSLAIKISSYSKDWTFSNISSDKFRNNLIAILNNLNPESKLKANDKIPNNFIVIRRGFNADPDYVLGLLDRFLQKKGLMLDQNGNAPESPKPKRW